MIDCIKRADLIARIKYYIEHTPEDSREHYAYSVVLNEVLNRPAADVVPVVHGRWSESKEHFYLNNGCKEWINFYCSECDAPNNSPTDYCPNCGAKMDLEA